MPRPTRRTVLTAALASLALGACSSEEVTAPDPSSAAMTSFPSLTPASGDPTPASMATASPAAGQVVQVAGPFDDRFTLSGLTLDGSTVSGTLRITSDVSELLELQVVAGFHDASGRLLGTSRFTHHLDGAHTHEEASAAPGASVDPHPSEEFEIKAPAGIASKVVSASVGVPVLVNE
ncbi:MAG TPA: hypothetical protein H9987_03100 [Candidatus Luteococcus avicola]|nr:hypothetical protein [Candidatus Luteococcus avicola]